MDPVVSQISWLYLPPLWVTGVIFLGLFVLAIEIGLRSGLRIHRANRKAGLAARGDVTIGALLALLGLLLAFTYAFALSRYDERRQAITDEVNALSTAFQRADLLAEPGRTKLRQSLLDYARTRLLTRKELTSRQAFQEVFERSLKAQSQIWPTTVAALKDIDKGPVETSIVTAINTVLDVHTKRVIAGFDTIPGVILVLLVAVSAFSLAVTAHNGGVQGTSSRWRMMIFALVLAALIMLIMDFDIAQRGLIRVSTFSIKMMISDMENALAT